MYVKKFAISPPVGENWEEFLKWSENGSKIYHVSED